MKRLIAAACVATALAAAPAHGQANPRAALLREYVEFLSIPNVASDTAAIRRNAEHLVEMMRRRGLSPRILPPAAPGGRPAVYGEWMVGAPTTLVMYAHFDGQPADAADWRSNPPWEPTLRTGTLAGGGEVVPIPVRDEALDPEWRLYARSASDDKAGIIALLAAVDRLRAEGRTPAVNLRFFFEGEEEVGSPFLREMLERDAALVAGDAWIVADGPVHPSGRRQIVYGVRGDMNVDVTIHGPLRPLHSGHYGNWAPNPAMRLARLLATMVDDEGRVLIPGWYDDTVPLTEAERAAFAEAAGDDAAHARSLGIARPLGGGRGRGELTSGPSLNVNGFVSAQAGEGARNVIPTVATATLDIRLGMGDDHERQFRRLVAHVEEQGYTVLDRDPTAEERGTQPRLVTIVKRPGAYNAQRTPMDHPLSRRVAVAVRSAAAEPVLLVPSLGGSLPLAIITEVLETVVITVPIVNADNNQHAEDENLRLGNLWEGIETMLALMTMD